MPSSVPPSKLSLEDLRLLSALGASGKLRAAAQSTGMDRPNAWRRINAIEERLGVMLFARHRTGYEPTPAGDEIVRVAIQVLQELDQVSRLVTGQPLAPTGSVRVIVTDALVGFMMPAIAELRATAPGIVVDLATAGPTSSFGRRQADIAIWQGKIPPPGLVERRLGALATAAYATQALAKSGDDALARAWIGLDEAALPAEARWLEQWVAPECIVHRVGALPALIAAVQEGVGTALLPCVVGDALEGLVRVVPPIASLSTPLWLLAHPERPRPSHHRTVLTALAAHCARHEHLFSGGQDGT